MNIRKLSLAAVLSLLAIPGLSAAAEGEWLVAPYIWAADVSWDLPNRGAGTIPFSTIVDKLDGAAIIRIEYARNKIGFTFDYVSMSLSDSKVQQVGPIVNSLGADLDLTLFEAGVFYRPSATDSGFDILAGVRETDVDSTVLVTIGQQPTLRRDANKGFTDVYVGARYLHRFTESWDFSVRGDYGFGGSDGSLNFMAGVGWRSKGAFGMTLAYRHLDFDIDQKVEGEAETSEFSFSGPALGFLFRF